jgi:hypothetical protein
MTSVKRDIEGIEGNRHVRTVNTVFPLDTVSIYTLDHMSDITKNVLSSRGIFFICLTSHPVDKIVMSYADKDLLLDTLKMLVEEEVNES